MVRDLPGTATSSLHPEREEDAGISGRQTSQSKLTSLGDVGSSLCRAVTVWGIL